MENFNFVPFMILPPQELIVDDVSEAWYTIYSDAFVRCGDGPYRNLSGRVAALPDRTFSDVASRLRHPSVSIRKIYSV